MWKFQCLLFELKRLYKYLLYYLYDSTFKPNIYQKFPQRSLEVRIFVLRAASGFNLNVYTTQFNVKRRKFYEKCSWFFPVDYSKSNRCYIWENIKGSMNRTQLVVIPFVACKANVGKNELLLTIIAIIYYFLRWLFS